MDRKQWFKDRIGKRVFGTKYCDCEFCQIIYDSGMIIGDAGDAYLAFAHEQDFQAEGTLLKYFDTKEERTKYEIENKL